MLLAGDFSALSRGKVTILVGRACLVPGVIGHCVLLEGGGLPRSPSAPRALRGVSARSSAKPSHNICGLPPTNTFRPLAPILSNLARNSPAAPSNIEFASLELQRFPAVSKNYRLKLCAKFVWVRPAIARRRRGQALSPPTGTSAWSDSRGLFGTFHARSSGSFAAEASPRRAPNGAIPPRLVVVKLDLRLVWCPKCSPPRRITVKMGCCGRSGLRFGHNCVGHGVCPPRACALT